ncbi:MAG: hypothetical protein ABI920_08880 [Casimicrobiaceae bacterium]
MPPCSSSALRHRQGYLAQALGHSAVRQGVNVVFATCANLTSSLNAARATGG